MNLSDRIRFEAKYTVNDETGCWEPPRLIPTSVSVFTGRDAEEQHVTLRFRHDDQVLDVQLDDVHAAELADDLAELEFGAPAEPPAGPTGGAR